MKRHIICAAIAAIAAVSGCNKSTPPEEVRDVAFYRSNPADLKAKLAECENNPGELQDTPNCRNAAQAKHLNMTGPSKVDYSGVMGK